MLFKAFDFKMQKREETLKNVGGAFSGLPLPA